MYAVNGINPQIRSPDALSRSGQSGVESSHFLNHELLVGAPPCFDGHKQASDAGATTANSGKATTAYLRLHRGSVVDDMLIASTLLPYGFHTSLLFRELDVLPWVFHFPPSAWDGSDKFVHSIGDATNRVPAPGQIQLRCYDLRKRRLVGLTPLLWYDS